MRYLLFFGLIVLTVACEEVIDIELDDVPPREVIEAALDGETGILRVRVTTTGPYFDAGAVNPVAGVSVEVSSDADNLVYVPTQTGIGTFVDTLAVEPGTRYTLRVQTPTDTYAAGSLLPVAVPIASIDSEFQTARGPREEGYRLEFDFQDPPGEANFYRLVHTVNDTLQTDPDDLLVTEDILFDGGFARVQLFQQTFDLGDTVQLELRHLDRAGYEYFNSLSDILSTSQAPNSGSAAPANPISNWDNEALGYFSAYYPTRMTLVIED